MNEIIYAGKHLLTFTVSRHSHASWEMIYCTSGSGQLGFDGYTLNYSAGEIAIIPPNVPHTNDSGDGFTNIHINMTSPSLTLRTPAVMHDDGNASLLHAFSGTFYQFSANTGRQTPLLSAYGNLISCCIASLQEMPTHSKVVEEIENVILLNYPDGGFELDNYLRSLPFSYDYLRKLFKKEVGITPHRYLSDKRLEAAAECLASSALCGNNISEIAHQCGFREPLYFSRVFKNKYGVAPSQYKTHRQESADGVLDGESMKIML